MNLSLRAYWFGIVLISIFLVGVSYADKSTGKKSFLSTAKEARESCTPFDLKSLHVAKVKGRWKLMDGKGVVHDFGYKAKRARATLSTIRQKQFSLICVIHDLFPPFIYFVPESQITKVIVVRHAEKAADNNAPGVELSGDGEKRATTLSNILNVSGVSAVFATKTSGGQSYKRTFETVNNYAQSKGFAVQYYKTVAEIVELIKEQYSGQSVLVAGHSSSVPGILEGLGIDDPPGINGQFNNLFVVFLMSDDTASMMHLKYEIHSNLN